MNASIHAIPGQPAADDGIRHDWGRAEVEALMSGGSARVQR